MVGMYATLELWSHPSHVHRVLASIGLQMEIQSCPRAAILDPSRSICYPDVHGAGCIGGGKPCDFSSSVGKKQTKAFGAAMVDFP